MSRQSSSAIQGRLPNDQENQISPDDLPGYELKQKYRKYFHEIVFRSHRGAYMMYLNAAEAEEKFIFSLWMLRGFVGVMMVIFIVVFESLLGFTIVSSLTVMMEILKTFDTPLDKYLRNLPNTYVKAASGWQELEQTAYCYLLQLDNPKITTKQIQDLYLRLVEKRAIITSNVIVSQDCYDKATIEETLKRMRRRKEELDTYIDTLQS